MTADWVWSEFKRRMRPSETDPGFDPAHWSGFRGDGNVRRMRGEEEEKKIRDETARVRGRPDE